ncbi:polyprenyl synthetase family protein [Candidatus Actinomarina]|nr:polyprenyl synthetase family protein [Candidatus Actinomarina sp.]
MDSNELTNIIPITSLWENLEKLEKRLFEVTVSKDDYLTEISQYLIDAGGKRFRPIISLLAGELGSGDKEKVIDAGISVELIHLGSLYHDDVIDEATTRRGVESTNRKWNATLAILAGDFLLARSSELAADNLGLESVKLLASTYAELVVGQTKEVQFSFNTTHSTDDYLEVIGGKTASLIRTSAKLGAMAANCPDNLINSISSWAWHNGIIFQITDDILDLNSDSETLGKPAGNDILEGTYTLPVLLALEKDQKKIEDILHQVKNSEIELTEILAEFNSDEIIEESNKFLNYHFIQSNEAIKNIENKKISDILNNLNEYLLQRSS